MSSIVLENHRAKRKSHRAQMIGLFFGVVAGATAGVLLELMGDVFSGFRIITTALLGTTVILVDATLILLILALNQSLSIEKTTLLYELRIPSSSILGSIDTAIAGCRNNPRINRVLRSHRRFFVEQHRYSQLNSDGLTTFCAHLDDVSNDVDEELLESQLAFIQSYPGRLENLPASFLLTTDVLDDSKNSDWYPVITGQSIEIWQSRRFGRGPRWLMAFRFISNFKSNISVPVYCHFSLSTQVSDSFCLFLYKKAEEILERIIHNQILGDLGIECTLVTQ